MHALIDVLTRRLVSSDGFNTEQDPFDVLHKIVKKDCIDAATFDMRTQADLMCMLVDNLELLETTTLQLKSMLKEINPEEFSKVKLDVRTALELKWKAANPERDDN